MSPTNALIYVENIRKALVQHDPANAEAYNQNAADYAAKIKALDAPLRERLAAIPEDRRWLVTSEGAFSYLTRDYGLREAYLWPINADEQGTPQQVRKVIDLVREEQHPCRVQREHHLRPRRQAGGQGDRRTNMAACSMSTRSRAEGGPVPTYLDLLNVTVDTIAKGFGQ